MAKQRLFDLPETKGEFKLAGKVLGMLKDKAFSEGQSAKGTEYQKLSFGVATTNDNTIYLDVVGYEKPEAFFYSKTEKLTERVPFKNRNVFKKEGYNLIGMDIRLEKDVNGKSVRKDLVELDAPKYIKENLKDDDSIFIMGSMEFSSYVKNEEKRRSKKYIPKKIYIAKDIDLDADDFVENCDFKQKIVYTGIEKNEDGTFTLSGKVITYQTIEDVDFIIENAKLAMNIKKKLKAYTAMDVVGKIINKAIIDESEEAEDDGWGEADPFSMAKKTYDNKLLVTGVIADSFDTETYTEEAVEKACKALADFGNTESEWGDTPTANNKVTEDDFDWE